MSINNEAEITVEELFFMEIPTVVIAAKKEQKQSETAAATYVITEEDIRRSGVTTIPELLRMVPGLNVAQIDTNRWAIGSRGFNGRFANMLLVMIDGRSVYTPLFSGVYWDVQDTMLEDIERIEIVRGPGGTLWGANAVNGVINIVTKSAKKTQGGLVSGGTGDRERGFGNVRYGDKLGEDVYFRTYAKYFNRDDFDEGNGSEWWTEQGGFRLDWDVSRKDTLIMSGDIYNGKADEEIPVSSLFAEDIALVTDTTDYSGGNVLLKWTRMLSNESDFTLKAYFDTVERETVVANQSIQTYDIDFQHRLPFGTFQEITWGLGYRFIRDDLDDSFTISFDPDNRQSHIFSTFVQDEISIMDNLNVTLGSKFEHNDYSGFEIQPSARMLWKVFPKHTVWSAVSRAVRTPSRADEDVRVNANYSGFEGITSIASIMVNQDLESEDLLAYEVGYRQQISRNISVDVTAFYNDYDDLSTLELGNHFFTLDQVLYMTIPLEVDNMMEGKTYGIEIASDCRLAKNWRLNSSYTFLQMELETDSGSSDSSTEELDEGSNPEHQFQLHSYLDLPFDLEYDTSFYYVSRLHKLDVSSYTRVDMRLGWEPKDNLEFSISLLNALDDKHKEFIAQDVGEIQSEIPRSFYVKATWQF